MALCVVASPAAALGPTEGTPVVCRGPTQKRTKREAGRVKGALGVPRTMSPSKVQQDSVGVCSWGTQAQALSKSGERKQERLRYQTLHAGRWRGGTPSSTRQEDDDWDWLDEVPDTQPPPPATWQNSGPKPPATVTPEHGRLGGDAPGSRQDESGAGDQRGLQVSTADVAGSRREDAYEDGQPGASSAATGPGLPREVDPPALRPWQRAVQAVAGSLARWLAPALGAVEVLGLLGVLALQLWWALSLRTLGDTLQGSAALASGVQAAAVTKVLAASSVFQAAATALSWQNALLLAVLLSVAVSRLLLAWQRFFPSTAYSVVGATVPSVAAPALATVPEWALARLGVLGPGGDLEAQVRNMEGDLGTTIGMLRALARHVEKLGVQFRVTRRTLRDSVNEAVEAAEVQSRQVEALSGSVATAQQNLEELQLILVCLQDQCMRQFHLFSQALRKIQLEMKASVVQKPKLVKAHNGKPPEHNGSLSRLPAATSGGTGAREVHPQAVNDGTHPWSSSEANVQRHLVEYDTAVNVTSKREDFWA